MPQPGEKRGEGEESINTLSTGYMLRGLDQGEEEDAGTLGAGVGRGPGVTTGAVHVVPVFLLDLTMMRGWVSSVRTGWTPA